MAKQRMKGPSLFEPTQTSVVPSVELQPPPAKIKDACPQCGGRSLKTVRAWEHENRTHYCAGGCLSPDRTEAFYFTPVAESFVEAAEREAAKKAITDEPEPPGINDGDVQIYVEPSKEIETEVVSEGVQQALIETGEKWEEHWKSMPEFKQVDLMPWKTVYVHFENREDMEKFAKLVKQKINLETQYIWYPQAEINKAETKRLVDQ